MFNLEPRFVAVGETSMIEVHSWPTPNGHKVHIMLEECGLPYEVQGVNIESGEQFTPEFLAISPNNRVPAIIDRDGPGHKPISVFESGAILIYLARKSGKFLPKDPPGETKVLEWLMWQMGGFGPMLGQAHHFLLYAPVKIEYAMDRYRNEAARLYRVLDKQLSERPFVAGDYSIADMAIFPWARVAKYHEQTLDDHPNVRRWLDAVAARPAVARALMVLDGRHRDLEADLTELEWDVLFGDSQYRKRK